MQRHKTTKCPALGALFFVGFSGLFCLKNLVSKITNLLQQLAVWTSFPVENLNSPHLDFWK
jgi:hypothetical protein